MLPTHENKARVTSGDTIRKSIAMESVYQIIAQPCTRSRHMCDGGRGGALSVHGKIKETTPSITGTVPRAGEQESKDAVGASLAPAIAHMRMLSPAHALKLSPTSVPTREKGNTRNTIHLVNNFTKKMCTMCGERAHSLEQHSTS